jgi:phosphoribosylanthranilate isomerase
MSIWIKICGNTSLGDALAAAEAGADAVGFVFAPSPRRVTAVQVAAITPHMPATVEKIGVFVDAKLEEIVSTVEACGLTGVQLHFDADSALPARLHERLGVGLRILRVVRFDTETAALCAVRVAEYNRNPHVDAVLVDSRTSTVIGGTGKSFDWAEARKSIFENAAARQRLIAAGGLNPANVAEAIATLRPWGVDVVSGVEISPGYKDAAKVREFVARVRENNRLIHASEQIDRPAELSRYFDTPDVPSQISCAVIDDAITSAFLADFSVNWIEPRDLLTPWRFDFAAKYIYARLREKKVNSEWGRSVYAFHLSIWNAFFEAYPPKHSASDFLDSFHKIIEGTRQTTEKGLHSLIPLARNGAPVNGAHRIVAALLLDKMVACAKTNEPAEVVDYDYRFFKVRAGLKEHPLASEYFDAMALEFCRLLPNIAVAVKFPAAIGRNEEVEQILNEHADIYYSKEVNLENEGPVQLIRMLYKDEPWLGNYETNFDGARLKADMCFTRRDPAHFYLLSYDNKEELVRAKSRVRDIFGISNNSMHITNTRDEALRVAKLAFSNSSIQFANARLSKDMPTFNRLLSAYRKALSGVEDEDDFCIDGSAVMAAYGIRDCADLDYISHNDQRLNVDSGHLISSHNEYGQYYNKKTIDDIIFHHCNHFYLEGMKFALLANVRDWKCARGKIKDQVDIALIDDWVAKPLLMMMRARACMAMLRFRNSCTSMFRKIISVLRKSSLNSARRRITRSIKSILT